MGTANQGLTRPVEAMATFEIVDLIVALDAELQRREDDAQRAKEHDLTTYCEYENW